MIQCSFRIITDLYKNGSPKFFAVGNQRLFQAPEVGEFIFLDGRRYKVYARLWSVQTQQDNPVQSCCLELLDEKPEYNPKNTNKDWKKVYIAVGNKLCVNHQKPAPKLMADAELITYFPNNKELHEEFCGNGFDGRKYGSDDAYSSHEPIADLGCSEEFVSMGAGSDLNFDVDLGPDLDWEQSPTKKLEEPLRSTHEKGLKWMRTTKIPLCDRFLKIAAERIVELQKKISTNDEATEMKELMAKLTKVALYQRGGNESTKYITTMLDSFAKFINTEEEYEEYLKSRGKILLDLGTYGLGHGSAEKTFKKYIDVDGAYRNFKIVGLEDPSISRDYDRNRLLEIRRDKKIIHPYDLTIVAKEVKRLLGLKNNHSLSLQGHTALWALCALMPKVYLESRFIEKDACRDFPYKCAPPLGGGFARLFASPQTFKANLKTHNITCLYMGTYVPLFDGPDEVFTKCHGSRWCDYEVFERTQQ